MPKISSIHSAVLVELRLVTDRQADRHKAIAYTAHSVKADYWVSATALHSQYKCSIQAANSGCRGPDNHVDNRSRPRKETRHTIEIYNLMQTRLTVLKLLIAAL